MFADNGFSNCNMTKMEIEFVIDDLPISYRQGDDYNKRTIAFKALNKQIFNHNLDEVIVEFDIESTFLDTTVHENTLYMNLTETIVCTGDITFDPVSIPELQMKTGEFIEVPRPIASSNQTESNFPSLRQKCKINYYIVDQNSDPPLANLTRYGMDTYLVIGTNNTAMVGLRTFELFAYYENYP